jgi:2-polyprenyl-3-methyl-5-hydroxy-6-metoxy-1,4-benzoquinol methylase
MTDYRQDLFGSYERHTSRLDGSDQEKLAWFRGYVQVNYMPTLRRIAAVTDPILEIGCNKGYVLATLHESGFTDLSGVDLAPSDLELARQIVPSARLEAVDAVEFLAHRSAAYQVILMKAVLEHIPKGQVLELLRRAADSVRPGGALLVDVPNMDWLFASHERYMDFTHESGFTPESLRQTMGAVFARVSVTPIDNALAYTVPGPSKYRHRARLRWAHLRRSAARRVVGTVLRWADHEGAAGMIWARSLLAVGEK